MARSNLDVAQGVTVSTQELRTRRPCRRDRDVSTLHGVAKNFDEASDKKCEGKVCLLLPIEFKLSTPNGPLAAAENLGCIANLKA